MLIILSSAYAISELRSEFGDLPPAFLPIGNQPLYKLQVAFGERYFNDIVLTVPDNFELHRIDSDFFHEHHVKVLPLPAHLSLGEALLRVLVSLRSDGPVSILFGDTLFEGLTPIKDSLVIGKSNENYDWQVDESGEPNIWAGFFSFSDAYLLILSLLQSDRMFVDAVRKYEASILIQRVFASAWYDLGHMHTYFLSKQQFTTERFFNDLTIRDNVIRKISQNDSKIYAEGQWFKQAPKTIKKFTPQLIDFGVDSGGKSFYELEYLPLPSLSELFVYGRLPSKTWETIFHSCISFLESALAVPIESTWTTEDSFALYKQKTLDRLEVFIQHNPDVNMLNTWVINGKPVPCLIDIIERCWEVLCLEPAIDSFIHGDFCFSNILYDSRLQRIKVIDPRGLSSDGELSSCGDLRYDIAKLAHSAIGLYDFIVAEHFSFCRDAYQIDFKFDVNRHYIDQITDTFLDLRLGGVAMRERNIQAQLVLLFLSMLPLHQDKPNRQKGFFANALRIFSESGL